MKLSKYIACICEGAAEQAIIECLLDANKLIFTYDDMIEGEVIRCRSAKKFEERYLRKGFDEKITVLRILDSRREKFKLSKAYAPKIDVINVITAPEIEMLIILNEGKYAEYKKSNKNVKSTEFLKEYFADASVLVSAIIEYKRVSNIRNGECTLADLLR